VSTRDPGFLPGKAAKRPRPNAPPTPEAFVAGQRRRRAGLVLLVLAGAGLVAGASRWRETGAQAERVAVIRAIAPHRLLVDRPDGAQPATRVRVAGVTARGKSIRLPVRRTQTGWPEIEREVASQGGRSRRYRCISSMQPDAARRLYSRLKPEDFYHGLVRPRDTGRAGGRAGERAAGAALARRLVDGRIVTLEPAAGPRRDAAGHLRAHVRLADGSFLAERLLRAGVVRPSPLDRGHLRRAAHEAAWLEGAVRNRPPRSEAPGSAPAP